MYIERELTPTLVRLAGLFPAIFLTGPRQAGKSTLLQHAFPNHRYLNLEQTDLQEEATDDPRGFINRLGGADVIIDEAQRAPSLFSYLQVEIDSNQKPGRFILSGSQNFLMLRAISQSLAGRVGVLTLPPLSLREQPPAQQPTTADTWMLNGGYPRLIATGDMTPQDFFPSYLTTYVQRDVRAETGVRDLIRFTNFLQLLATRVGSPLNLAGISREIGADARTISSWLAILESSYLIFRLSPWHTNLGKRIIKAPKLYFYDTGLLCSLLGLTTPDALLASPERGHIFENAIIAEFAKRFFAQGINPPISYWRTETSSAAEIDLITHWQGKMSLYEIKSAQTANRKFASTIQNFNPPDSPISNRQVIYDGPDGTVLQGIHFTNWRALAAFDLG
ncbi:MAG: ATP-binding protein [Propionibacteriaceae bacterium]|jgi:predicted AAA+ superfamily ATPase|nr:ATP-binding protein [Propionibacteriaceae bacterium]